MGDVISLDAYRARRDPFALALQRLDAAVVRLDPIVRRGGRLSPTIERELRSIAVAVSAGLPGTAAERAERLLGVLEHPLASG